MKVAEPLKVTRTTIVLPAMLPVNTQLVKVAEVPLPETYTAPAYCKKQERKKKKKEENKILDILGMKI